MIRDPFFWLFLFMVVMDVSVIAYGVIRVRLFLRSHKAPVAVEQTYNNLKDRLRDYQNRPI